MNFVPCLTWVKKGIAKPIPDKLQLTTDELKDVIQETKEHSRNLNPDEDDEKASDNNDDDFETRYNLQDYDEDDGADQPFINISDVATFIDNKEDNYITDYDAVKEDDDEDEEDFVIKENDNLLLVGHVEEESSVLEIYIYNKEDDELYVHHDIVLPAYPLALEWLDYHPGDDTAGNYVAVGDMTSIIKIWDLDVVDILEPDFCLGKELKKNNAELINRKYHSDAVLSLSWNKHMRNILASGSADSSVIVWDLQKAKPLNKLTYHKNKVQSLQWHPFESSFLLSGCTDGVIKLYDSRTPGTECKSWKVKGEIERVSWNLQEPLKFLCSTDKGFVHSVDMKTEAIEHSVKAHLDAVTALDMCPTQPNILITASMDRTIKVWDLQKLSHIRTQKLKIGSIYTAKFASDSELTVAIGGNDRSNSLKVMDLSKIIDNAECITKLEMNNEIDIKSEKEDYKDCSVKKSLKKHKKQNANTLDQHLSKNNEDLNLSGLTNKKMKNKEVKKFKFSSEDVKVEEHSPPKKKIKEEKI